MPKANGSQRGGNPRAQREDRGSPGAECTGRRSHHLEQAADAAPLAAQALPGTISPAGRHSERLPFPEEKRPDVPADALSHFTFDGHGVPNLVNRCLTIPLVTGGTTPTDCKRDRSRHLITASLLCALQSLREPQLWARPSLEWCRHKTKKTVPAWEAYAWIDLLQLEKSISCQSWHCHCTCPSQTGHFPTGSKLNSGEGITIQTVACNNWQIRVTWV